MPHQTIVLLGNLPADTVPLDLLVEKFGWSLEKAATFNSLRDLAAGRDVVAVLFEASMWSLPWSEVLRLVLDAAPNALPILCHRFSDTLPWPELADAGAFHAMPLPLASGEVRQSLGFVWAARSRTDKRRTATPGEIAAIVA